MLINMWITDEWIPPVLEACQYWNGSISKGEEGSLSNQPNYFSLVSVVVVLVLLVTRDRFFLLSFQVLVVTTLDFCSLTDYLISYNRIQEMGTGTPGAFIVVMFICLLV